MVVLEHQQTQVMVEVFSVSACDRCINARKKIIKLIEQLNRDISKTKNLFINYQEVDVIEYIDRAVTLGILTTPSIVINEQLVYTNMPEIADLKVKLLKFVSISVNLPSNKARS